VEEEPREAAPAGTERSAGISQSEIPADVTLMPAEDAPDDIAADAPGTGGSAEGTVAVARRPNASPWWLVAAALLILWLARPILGPFVIAAVLAYAFSPLVANAERRSGMPRLVIVVIGYSFALTGLGLLVWFVTGQLVTELQLLGSSGPDSLAQALRELLGNDTIVLGGTTISVQEISSQIQAAVNGLVSSPGSAIELAKQIGELALNAVLVIIVTFYLLVDGQRFISRTVRILPPEHRERTAALLGRIHEVLGRFLRGQLLLVALVSIVVYVILGPILHLRYALAIGILTGLLEVIPLIGPVVATAIAATDAFAQAGTQTAILVIVIYAVLRQVEDQLVMPVVIGRAVHLHPVVTIFAVLVGLSTYGILGGLLGVPAAAAVNVVFRELYPPEPAVS
jgi:predicted PurR-regulated permease PerM